MDVASLLDMVRLGVAGIVIAFGLLLMLGGALGLLRFPDFYTRLHAASSSDVVGAAIVALGLAIGAWDWRVALKLMLLAGLIALIGPLIVQLLGNAAHSGGLSPIAGRYVAPRPG